MIEKIKVWWWTFFRTFRTAKQKAQMNNQDFWCFLGFHKMKRGKEWVAHRRLDECTKCKFFKWYHDKPGMQLHKYETSLKYGKPKY